MFDRWPSPVHPISGWRLFELSKIGLASRLDGTERRIALKNRRPFGT